MRRQTGLTKTADLEEECQITKYCNMFCLHLARQWIKHINQEMLSWVQAEIKGNKDITENRCLGPWRKENSHIWLVWCKIVQPLWKIVQQFLKNFNTCVNLWCSNFTPGLAPKKNETIRPNFNMGLHSHISHDTETWKHHTPMVN